MCSFFLLFFFAAARPPVGPSAPLLLVGRRCLLVERSWNISGICIPAAVSPNSRCSNGFPGVESENGKTCCLAYCLECAGVGCSTRGNASHCCATEIRVQGEECDVAGEAPCFIVPPVPWEPEHTMLYFLYFFIIPFAVVAALCNRGLLPGCREKADPDDPANTAHLHGHNTGPAEALSKKSAAPAARAKAAGRQAEKEEEEAA